MYGKQGLKKNKEYKSVKDDALHTQAGLAQLVRAHGC